MDAFTNSTAGIVMDDFERAKIIYADIVSAINKIELTHEIYCEIPSFIEFNGIIYERYQCLSEEESFKWEQKAVKQLMDITQGKVKYYLRK